MAKSPLPHDPALPAIAAAGSTLSFAWLRSRFGKDHDRKNELDFGHAVLPSIELLDQYLYTYGPMISSQWRHAAGLLPKIQEPIRLIDYGCGQGVAGLLLHDHAAVDPLRCARDVVLIEPSDLALRRATSVYTALAPKAEVRPIAKTFDALLNNDVQFDDDLSTVHIFSNSLDLPGFDHYALFERMLTKGRHAILAVSHDRAFRGGTVRFEQLKAALEDDKMANDLTMRTSTLEQFACDNPRASDAVVWMAEVDVHN